MKREIVKVGLLITFAGFLVAGCYGHRTVVATAPSGEVVVTEAPPELRPEVITVAPSTEHVWVRGYWMSNSGRWVWVPGHYERRPRVGATYVAGHWDRTPRGWVWTQGHWR